LKGHSGTKIAIVGAGDTAFDYALSLAKRNEIFLLNRAEKPKCLPLLFKRAIKTEKIFYFKNTCIKEISAQKNKINLKLKTNNSERNLFVDFLLFAIGREPCLDFLSESILSSKNKLEEKGKLFLIGDVKNKRFRQLAIAAGDGIEAAMKINNILRG
jgi:thioredoxin reductase